MFPIYCLTNAQYFMTYKNFEYVFNLQNINDLAEVKGKVSSYLTALLD